MIMAYSEIDFLSYLAHFLKSIFVFFALIFCSALLHEQKKATFAKFQAAARTFFLLIVTRLKLLQFEKLMIDISLSKASYNKKIDNF